MPRNMVITIALMTLGLVTFGLFTAGSHPIATEAAQIPTKAVDTQELKDLHDRISLMNLLTGLWLDENQYERILPIVEDASSRICEIKDEALSLAADGGFQADLRRLHDTLLSGGQVSDDERHEIERTSGRIHGLHMEAEGIIYEAGKDVKTILNENQLYLARTFEPCLFLPEDPNSPTLVGQVRPDNRGLEMLTRIREAPSHIFKRRIDQIVDGVIEKEKAHLHHDFDTQAERKRLKQLFMEVRKMDDEEFSLRKGEILDEFFHLATTEKEMEYNSYTDGLVPKDRTALKLGRLFTGEGKPEIIRAFLARS